MEKKSGIARQTFAKNIKTVRTAKNLSQEKLADLSGLHRTYIGAVERGERNVSIDNMERIANALAINIISLLKNDNI